MENEIGREAVLGALAERAPKSMHLMEVVSALALPKPRRDVVRDVLDELTELKMVKELPGNRFRVVSRKERTRSLGDSAPRGKAPRERKEKKGDELFGWLSVHPRGFAFVATDDEGPDVFVPPTARKNALHGDRVRITAWPSSKGREGEVREVVRRGVGRVAGVLHTARKKTWIETSNPRGPARVEVVGTIPLGVKAGDEVVAQIGKWPDYNGDVMEARVLSALGTAGSAGVEIEKIKIREGIVEEFEADVIAEAQAFGTGVRASDIEGREDLRDLDLVTIDPPTARDHDDAVWAERLGDGAYRVIIAIADVSHYVREGTAIDRAATDRSTSIYLPDRVIPMLPHELSSNLASLVPDEDRLTMAVEVEVGPRGAVRRHRFIEGVMRSRARLSYGGVARALGLSDEPEIQEEAESRRELLQALWEVSKLLRAKRRKRGGLDFDLPEAKIILDDDSEPLDIVRSRTDPGLRKTYGMIEDLMLLANETVAADLSRRNMPAIYRVHGPPKEQRVELFAALAESLGHPFDVEDHSNPKAIAAFLRKVEGTEHAQALSFLLLRSMQQAAYDTKNIGHFALAASFYLHFTSPIRRYPDLAVHRVVRSIIRQERVKKKELAERLAAQASGSSRLERRALLVDREATNLYRAILMKDRVGETFEAAVTGVAEHGIYIAFDEPFVEARIPIDTLGDDWYELDRLGLRLVGSRSGHSFSLGDRVTVRLEDVSIEARELRCVLIREQSEAKPGRDQKERKRGGRHRTKRRDEKRVARDPKGKPKKARRTRRR